MRAKKRTTEASPRCRLRTVRVLVSSSGGAPDMDDPVYSVPLRVAIPPFGRRQVVRAAAPCLVAPWFRPATELQIALSKSTQLRASKPGLSAALAAAPGVAET